MAKRYLAFHLLGNQRGTSFKAWCSFSSNFEAVTSLQTPSISHGLRLSGNSVPPPEEREDQVVRFLHKLQSIWPGICSPRVHKSFASSVALSAADEWPSPPMDCCNWGPCISHCCFVSGERRKLVFSCIIWKNDDGYIRIGSAFINIKGMIERCFVATMAMQAS